MFDLLIKNGMVIDGTKNASAYKGDIGISQGKIAAIERQIPSGAAREVLDAKGLTVAPGFIDMHSHADTSFLINEKCESKLYQGVTSELAGQCGYTIYPCPDDRIENIRNFEGTQVQEFASTSFADFMKKTRGKRMGTNLIPLIGHGALRCGVMGYDDAKASLEQCREMRCLLERDMEAGAFGLSLGLGYTPGVSSDKDELCAVGEIVAKYGGIVTSHMRYQNIKTPEALEEMYEIYRRTGAHVHIAHFKASGKKCWGKAPEFVQNVHDAQKSGVNVTVDVYPYRAASSDITNCFPKWSIKGGKAMAINRLFGEDRKKIINYLEERFHTQEDGEGFYIVTTEGLYPQADGKNIWQLSCELGLSMAETAAKVAIETKAKATCISFAMCDEDVEYMLSQEDFAIGSDGKALPMSAEENSGKPHPRNFGTFPRFLRIAREKGICSIEKAVHRITGLPAEMLGITDRGVLKEGMTADITIFDSVKVTDKATFINPFQKPEGIIHVLNSGKPAIQNGKLTENRLGSFILKKGR